MPRREDAGAAKRGSHDKQYDQLVSMHMDELQQKARDVGVPHPSELRKEELISAIKKHTK